MVDRVIISANATKQELFYVAASRGRGDIAIVTSDANGLASLLGIYGATVGAGVGEPDRSICSSPRTRHGASFESEYAAVNTEG
jgi:hypothetical protein